ncbi:MAG: hypothetical protein OEV87_07240 [Phycisphaerae bacterium]|nr:hypothetical protein [Phycisphaerae bacterium]
MVVIFFRGVEMVALLAQPHLGNNHKIFQIHTAILEDVLRDAAAIPLPKPLICE